MTDRVNRASGESGVPGGMSAAREPEPTFKPGDRVVCIDASASGDLLTAGGVSIVAEVNELDELLLRMTCAEEWWCVERFRTKRSAPEKAAEGAPPKSAPDPDPDPDPDRDRATRMIADLDGLAPEDVRALAANTGIKTVLDRWEHARPELAAEVKAAFNKAAQVPNG